MLRTRRHALRPRVLAAVLLLLGGLAGQPARAADHKQVLVLYSTRSDAQFSIVGENELTRTLSLS